METKLPSSLDHAQRSHAICSASGAERWSNCPGSVGLALGLPEGEPSKWALEGTRCHELSENILARWLSHWKSADRPHPMKVPLDRDWIDVELRPQYLDTLDPDDSEGTYSMVDYALTYVHVVLEELTAYYPETAPVGWAPPSVLIEKRLVFDEGMKMFGTADLIATGMVADGTLRGLIVDLKYGKGKKVVAEGNLQLRYYACALRRCSSKPLSGVRVVIVQPRLSEFFTPVDYTRAELMEYETALTLAAERALWQAAFPSKREFKRGSWCQWCPAKTANICPEIRRARQEKDLAMFAEALKEAEVDV